MAKPVGKHQSGLMYDLADAKIQRKSSKQIRTRINRLNRRIAQQLTMNCICKEGAIMPNE